jgi:hypothetical protein
MDEQKYKKMIIHLQKQLALAEHNLKKEKRNNYELKQTIEKMRMRASDSR